MDSAVTGRLNWGVSDYVFFPSKAAAHMRAVRIFDLPDGHAEQHDGENSTLR